MMAAPPPPAASRSVKASAILAPITLAPIILGLAACSTAPPARPDPTGLASADMVRVLAAYQASGAKPVEQLSLARARSQPSIGDAAASTARQMGVPAKLTVAKVTDILIPGATGQLAARVYDPQAGHGPAPIILYFHGGGWVFGTLDSDDAADRALAQGTGAIVLSVAYRLAPEARFPAGQDDAEASYAWLLKNAASIGADPRRIALAGESAGGNLAIDTAIWVRDKGLPGPVHELLIYPVVGTGLNTPSYAETTEAVPLNRAAMAWFLAHTTSSPAELKDSRLDVIGAADLHGLPPTTIVSAQIDPVRSENEALAQKLQALGVPVEQRIFPGVTHAFFGMGAVVAQAKAAEDFAAMRLKASFVLTPPPAPIKRRHHARHAAG